MLTPENGKIVPEEVLQENRKIKQLVKELVDFGNFSVLEGLDSQDITQIVIRLIRDNEAKFFFKNWEYFKGVDGEEVITFLLDRAQLKDHAYVVDALMVFKNVNQRKILDELIRRELWEIILAGLNLRVFKFKLDNRTAEMLLERGCVNGVARNLDKIEDIDRL